MKPRFFATPDEFRAWLEENHESASEVVVGFYKKPTGRPSLTWTESVREALCFGWIDGVRRRIDDDSYSIRFTPRKRGSNWSLVNVRHVEELTRAGRMHPAGIEAFEARTPEKTGVYTYENRHEAKLSPEHEEQFQRERASVGVLPGAAARLPADGDLLGRQPEARGNACTPAGHADRRLGTPSPHRPAQRPWRLIG